MHNGIRRVWNHIFGIRPAESSLSGNDRGSSGRTVPGDPSDRPDGDEQDSEGLSKYLPEMVAAEYILSAGTIGIVSSILASGYYTSLAATEQEEFWTFVISYLYQRPPEGHVSIYAIELLLDPDMVSAIKANISEERARS